MLSLFNKSKKSTSGVLNVKIFFLFRRQRDVNLGKQKQRLIKQEFYAYQPSQWFGSLWIRYTFGQAVLLSDWVVGRATTGGDDDFGIDCWVKWVARFTLVEDFVMFFRVAVVYREYDDLFDDQRRKVVIFVQFGVVTRDKDQCPGYEIL